MEDENKNWVWGLIIIGIVVYFVFFNSKDNSKDMSYITPNNSKQSELESRLDEQEQRLNEQQDLVEKQKRRNQELQDQTEQLNDQIQDQSNQLQDQSNKQSNYVNCVKLWSNIDDYIKPSDEAHCRIYLGQ